MASSFTPLLGPTLEGWPDLARKNLAERTENEKVVNKAAAEIQNYEGTGAPTGRGPDSL